MKNGIWGIIYSVPSARECEYEMESTDTIRLFDVFDATFEEFKKDEQSKYLDGFVANSMDYVNFTSDSIYEILIDEENNVLRLEIE
jgi:hypothetical protein